MKKIHIMLVIPKQQKIASAYGEKEKRYSHAVFSYNHRNLSYRDLKICQQLNVDFLKNYYSLTCCFFWLFLYLFYFCSIKYTQIPCLKRKQSLSNNGMGIWHSFIVQCISDIQGQKENIKIKHSLLVPSICFYSRVQNISNKK